MHKYLKLTMDAMESNMTAIAVAVVVVIMAVVGWMYWQRREGLAGKEDKTAKKAGSGGKEDEDEDENARPPMLTKEEADKLVNKLMEMNSKKSN